MSALLFLILDIVKNVLIALGLFCITASCFMAMGDRPATRKYRWWLFGVSGLSCCGAVGLATLLSHY